MKKKKIVVVTGTRAEYGALKPLLQQIKENPKFQLYLIVAGMHLSKKFGYSVKEIIHDGFKISGKVVMVPSGNTGYHMAIGLSEGIKQFSELFKKIKPDFNIIIGDRDEAFAAAIAAMHVNIINVHIHGGDTSKGGIDEYMRHAITKISNIHFAPTPKSAQRIVKLGEDKKYVFVTGSPAIDGIAKKYQPENKILRKYGLKNGYALVVQHPVTTQTKDSAKQITVTLNALVKLGKEAIIIGPNSDAGHNEILRTINQYVKRYKFFKFYTNLPREEYLSLLKYCDFIIGNSSSGIIDTPSFKKPAINIGIRQFGRQSANNVINVEHNVNSILKGINYAYTSRFRQILQKCKSPYGNGKASKRMLRILSNIKMNNDLLQKKITY